MKFVYEYRTSDNVRHTGVVSASNRDAAFAALRARGIRPGSVADAPGFFNKLFGRGKRWIAIGVLAVLCVTLAIAVGRGVLTAPQPSAVESTFDSPLRRQVIGDAAIIEKGVRTGWADVFALEGERFLASFAVPGVPAAIRSTTEEELRKALDSDKNGEAVSSPLQQKDQSTIEARQIKAMVEGMKADIRARLEDGWTIAEVGNALVRRQEQEIAYYQRAKNEIEQAKGKMTAAEVEELWERRNAMLRGMGIRLVPMPE